ncbi:hypothetical protein Ccrd_024321, partial [Cynara cardunculus var. scolymus]
MVEKRLGKGRLVLFATQALCAFLLFHLLYVELNFKPSPSSQQIQLDIVVTGGRQILSDWKQPADDHHLSSAAALSVKKDHHHNHSLQYLLTTLLR